MRLQGPPAGQLESFAVVVMRSVSLTEIVAVSLYHLLMKIFFVVMFDSISITQ